MTFHASRSRTGQIFDKLSDWTIRRLRPGWVRDRTAQYLARYERFGPLQWINLPEGQRLTVIAPHPDDESIGCGGLIAAWTQQRGACDVVFLTAGEQGDRRLRQATLAPAMADQIRMETVAKRRAEAVQALGILKCKGHWLGGTDGALHQDAGRLIAALQTLWAQSPPDVICVPFPADRHADHAVAARIVAKACQRLVTTPLILAYEVWSPAPINAVLDINAVADLKWQSIAVHQSQVTTTDYVAAAKALNSYRAIAGGRTGYAEGYFVTDRDQFSAMTTELVI